MTRPWSRDPMIRTGLELLMLLGLMMLILAGLSGVFLLVTRWLG